MNKILIHDHRPCCTAKTICSGHFVSKRNIQNIYSNELTGLGSMFAHEIDEDTNSVMSYLLSPISIKLGLPSAKAFYSGEKLYETKNNL